MANDTHYIPVQCDAAGKTRAKLRQEYGKPMPIQHVGDKRYLACPRCGKLIEMTSDVMDEHLLN